KVARVTSRSRPRNPLKMRDCPVASRLPWTIANRPPGVADEIPERSGGHGRRKTDRDLGEGRAAMRPLPHARRAIRAAGRREHGHVSPRVLRSVVLRPSRPATGLTGRFQRPSAPLPGPRGPRQARVISVVPPAAEDHTSRWIMRSILVCPDDFLWRLIADSGEPRLAPLYLVESARARTRIAQRGGEVLAGDLEREALYRRAFRTGHEPVLLAVERPRQARIVAAIRRAAPHAPILALAEDRVPGGEPDGVTSLGMEAVSERFLAPALERAVTRARVERIRDHFAPAERVLIMMQDDPDPDAIASGLALRAVLGRNKTAAPIATFGTITRPENRAMTRILEIDVEQIKPRALDEYDMVAMVDAQPSFFEETFERVDLVVDHHPEEAPVRAALKDVRPGYGATA